MGIPFDFNQRMYDLDRDVGSAAYWVVVSGLVLSAAMIVLECLFALDAKPLAQRPAQRIGGGQRGHRHRPTWRRPASTPSSPFCAWTPHRAGDRARDNTPHRVPSRRPCGDGPSGRGAGADAVAGSTSNAQNVNAAVTRVRGVFVWYP
ncbi:Response regulatory domain-containing protein OS=Streptomyces antimycoticus OX=68175 GN=SSPO_013620 PE=4 SV=1 [Streptomyces antimycoticus]